MDKAGIFGLIFFYINMDYTIKKLLPTDVALAKALIEAWHTNDGATQVIYPREKYSIKRAFIPM